MGYQEGTRPNLHDSACPAKQAKHLEKYHFEEFCLNKQSPIFVFNINKQSESSIKICKMHSTYQRLLVYVAHFCLD